MTQPSMPQRTKRGRPAIVHDNRRVQAFVQRFAGAFCDLAEELPALNDVLTGITHLQTEGQDSSRPLSKHMLLRVLHGCDSISTEAVAVALVREYSKAAVARYTAHARTASKAIEALLDRHSDWEASAGTLQAARDDLDLPFLAGLTAAMEQRPRLNLPL
jgi:hypothetical protein